MRTFFRVAVGLVVVLAVATGVIWYLALQQLTHVYTVRASHVAVSEDPALRARGEHLVESRGCQDCHESDYGGKIVSDDRFVGRIVASNLTRGAGGIGDFTPADYDRAIRHGVGRDGHALVLMPSEDYALLSDSDLAAIIAYLRALPPIDRELPKTQLAFPIRAVGVIRGNNPLLAASRIWHDTPHLERRVTETPEYGGYVAAVCVSCHRADFSGGHIAAGPPSWPPAANLTPGGRLKGWSQEQFVTTMRTGKTPDGRVLNAEAMPWRSFGRMDDVELRALWLYLRTLPAK
jgi:mono/diheme cytochrome c family protein